MTINPKIGSYSWNVTNSGNRPSILNITFELQTNLSKVLLAFKLNLPIDSDDNEYQRELFKSNIDLDKAFTGIHGSTFIKNMLGTLAQFIDFELKLPLLKVKKKIYS